MWNTGKAGEMTERYPHAKMAAKELIPLKRKRDSKDRKAAREPIPDRIRNAAIQEVHARHGNLLYQIDHLRRLNRTVTRDLSNVRMDLQNSNYYRTQFASENADLKREIRGLKNEIRGLKNEILVLKNEILVLRNVGSV